MNLNAFLGDEDIINEHEVAWLSKDWDAVGKLADSFKEPAENTMFALMNNVTYTKERVDVGNKDYSAYMMNNAMSQHADCIYSAYVMNMLHDLPDQANFDYYLATIRKGKRYGKWAKLHEDLEQKLHCMLIAKYYSVSIDTAIMYKETMVAKGIFNQFLRKAKGIATEQFVQTVAKTKKEQKDLLKLIKEY